MDAKNLFFIFVFYLLHSVVYIVTHLVENNEYMTQQLPRSRCDLGSSMQGVEQ
jgi:hypothetical protein